MSAGYASRLSDYSNKGVCGLPEREESHRSTSLKVKKLASWIRSSKHTVVLTGAGISTSAGVPDFRGPNGIWTIEQKQQQQQPPSSKKTTAARNKRKRETKTATQPIKDFSQARPTLTHRAITHLVDANHIQYCVTQNVDGLHKRSGLSRSKHAALHGCAFTERCTACGLEHFRDFDVGGMSFQKTGRKCCECQGDLIDTLLDWEDDLPEQDYERAVEECKKADLVLCLGTSLRIEPVNGLPALAKKYVIVNLQDTPKDKNASMKIRARVDDVMEELMSQLDFLDWDQHEPIIERTWRAKHFSLELAKQSEKEKP